MVPLGAAVELVTSHAGMGDCFGPGVKAVGCGMMDVVNVPREE